MPATSNPQPGPPVPERVLCHVCYTIIDSGDRFCRHCGSPLDRGLESDGGVRVAASGSGRPNHPAPPSAQPETTLATSEPSAGKFAQRLIVVGLLLGLGPLALPALWRSPAFGARWKQGLTVVVLVSAVAGCVLIWRSLQTALEPLRQLHELNRL